MRPIRAVRSKGQLFEEGLAGAGQAPQDSKVVRGLLRLTHTLGDRCVPSLGLDDGQLLVPEDENVVGGVGFAASALTFEAAFGDLVLAEDAAAFDDAPPSRSQGGVDVLGSGLGLVEHDGYSVPLKAWCRSDFFSSSRASSFC